MATLLSILAMLTAPLAWSEPVLFSHRQHAGAACARCHPGSANGRGMGTMRASGCMTCHRGGRSAAITEVARLARSGRPIPAERVFELPSWVWFPHARHRKTECRACHGAVARRDRPEEEIPINMAFCRDCHERTNARNACGTCHADKGARAGSDQPAGVAPRRTNP